MTGIELIAKEREEQLTKHNRSIRSDHYINGNYELCSAASMLLYNPTQESPMELLRETVLKNWNQSILIRMDAKSYKDRLVIAGALIAAEIDRLNFDTTQPPG